jgi:hypothetical protein
MILRKEEGQRDWCVTYYAVGLTTIALLIDEAYAGVGLSMKDHISTSLSCDRHSHYPYRYSVLDIAQAGDKQP